MTSYHISPATKKVGACSAKDGNCPFKGGHYSTTHEATRANLRQQLGEEAFQANLGSNEVVDIYSNAMRDAFISSFGEASEEAYRWLEKKQEFAYAKAYRAFIRDLNTLDISEEKREAFQTWATAKADEHEKAARKVKTQGLVPREEAMEGAFIRDARRQHGTSKDLAKARFRLWVKETEVNTRAHLYNQIAAQWTGDPVDKDNVVKTWLGNKALELQATTPPPVKKVRPNPYKQ